MNRRGFLKTLAVAFLAGPALLAEQRPKRVFPDTGENTIAGYNAEYAELDEWPWPMCPFCDLYRNRLLGIGKAQIMYQTQVSINNLLEQGIVIAA